MSRLPDWRARLALHIAANARVAYRPGSHDCILFAGGARAAVRGEDLTGAYVGHYSTLEEGFKLLRSLGHGDHVAAITTGLEEVPVAYAQMGDLVELEGDDGIAAMGVVGGDHIYVGRVAKYAEAEPHYARMLADLRDAISNSPPDAVERRAHLQP